MISSIIPLTMPADSGGLLGGGWTWSVKEFNQVYKWSFDYVRWRTGQNPDGSSPAVETVLAAANPCDNGSNPCVAPWTDYTTPVQIRGGRVGYGLPDRYTARSEPQGDGHHSYVLVQHLQAQHTTLTVYYGTAAPGSCNLNNPQPPNCMQPFPNFGFQEMLAANYRAPSARGWDTGPDGGCPGSDECL